MKSRINVGVVGCGYWGPNLIRNFNSLPECHLSAICDLDIQRLNHLKSLYPAAEIHTEFKDFLARPGLNAVVIATSAPTHYGMAKESLLAGKHVFIEKPMATSSAECDELVQLASARGLTLMVGHTYLYSAPVRRIKDIIASGDIGDIRYINARRLNLGLFQRNINVTWDLAPHDISIVLFITGLLPNSVNCQGNSHVTKGIEDVTNMSMNFENGVFATLQNSWLDPRKVREMTIVGSRKMIVYDDVQQLEKVRIYDTRVDAVTPPHYDTFGEFHFSYHYGDSHIPYIKQEEPLKVECQHFLECVRTGARPLTDGIHGANVVRVLEACTRSLKQHGAAVAFDVATAMPALAKNGASHLPAKLIQQ
jgi:predicted dehydrogenase